MLAPVDNADPAKETVSKDAAIFAMMKRKYQSWQSTRAAPDELKARLFVPGPR